MTGRVARLFLRRREVLLPTVWGWLALGLAATVAIMLAGRNLHAFLAIDEPVGARILVVEGWMPPSALDEVITTIHARGYERVVTVGGPIEAWPRPPQPTYAELAADYLTQHGIPPSAVTAVPGQPMGRERTYRTALALREWALRSELKPAAIDVYSIGTHARRSRLLFRMALGPEVRVGVYAAHSFVYNELSWWDSSVGVRDVLEQAVQFFWVKLFFWPPAP